MVWQCFDSWGQHLTWCCNGVSRRRKWRRLSHWLINQHWARWRGLDGTQREARELISGPNLAAKPKFLSLNRTQSRVVIGLLTGHNTLRRHLHLLRLLDSPVCWRRGVKEETSAHILCECKALASLRHAYLGSFFLEPEEIKRLSLGAIWNFGKVTGLPWFCYGSQRACFKRPRCIGTLRSQTHIQSNLTSINGYQYFRANKQVHNSEFTSLGSLLYTTLFRVPEDRHCKLEALLWGQRQRSLPQRGKTIFSLDRTSCLLSFYEASMTPVQ
jgi:hypothetical protein